MRRREFLKGAALGAAAVSVAPTAMAVEAARKPRKGISRKEMPDPGLRSEDLIFRGKPFTGKVTCQGRPLPGVIVTNGRDSVKTTADGTYVLPEFSKARFISVCTPSGTCTDWFYVDAWRLLGGFDFTLQPIGQTAGRGCRFLHIADSEIRHAGSAGFVKDLKALADREKCAFIVHTGDICGREGLIAHSQVMNDVSMGRRCVYCLGNHDIVSTWPWGEAQFEAVYGPSWYSFDVGGVHFVVTPMVTGDRPSSYDEDQIADWLRGDLALIDPKMPVVLFNHFPPNSNDDAKCGVVYGTKRPLDLRTACNYRGIVYGHSHNSWFRRRGGIAFVNTSNPQMGGIDHSPNCTRVVMVSATGEIASKSFFGDYAEMRSERAGAVWETKLPAMVMYGGLVDGGNTVFCATSDDDGTGTGFVCAVDKADGRIRWKSRVANTIKGSLALASGNVIGTDVEGRVYAFRISDGAEMWRVDMSEGVVGFRPMMSCGTVASSDGKLVAVGVGRRQGVIDAATGRVLWRDAHYKEGEPIATCSAFAEGVIVTPGNWVPFRCLDAATGRMLWTFGSFSFPGARPLIRDGRVLIASGDMLVELELKTGREFRRKSYGGHCMAILGDILETKNLYLKGMVGRGLVAIDKESLEIVWKGEVGASLVATDEYAHKGMKSLNTTPIRVAASTVCAACADGTIHFWDLVDGKKVREIRTGAPYLGGVIASSGRIFAADMSGMIRAFDM